MTNEKNGMNERNGKIYILLFLPIPPVALR